MIGRGDNLRHPLYIRDMIEAFRLAMYREEALGQVLLVGGERAITTNELVETFCRVLKLPRPRIRIPYGWGKALAAGTETVFGWLKKEPPISRRSLEFFDTNNAFDIGKAKRVLGFHPRYTFEAGLEATREWLARA
jgi:nucleoside-diphosphate-sugar epimerase